MEVEWNRFRLGTTIAGMMLTMVIAMTTKRFFPFSVPNPSLWVGRKSSYAIVLDPKTMQKVVEEEIIGPERGLMRMDRVSKKVRIDWT
jgi:hypothetical protein